MVKNDSREEEDPAFLAAVASERRWRWAISFFTPVAIGAAFLGAWSLMLVAFAVVARRGPVLIVGLAAVTLSMLGGAAAGLVYSLLRLPRRRFPRIGPYVTGVAVVMAYLVAMLYALHAIDPVPKMEPHDPVTWIILLALAFVFGLGPVGGAFADSTKFPARPRRGYQTKR